jgi:hypothetical protein
MTNVTALTQGQGVVLWHEVYEAGVEMQRAMGLPQAPAWMLDSAEESGEMTAEQLLELELWGKACEAWEDDQIESTRLLASERRWNEEEDWGDITGSQDEAELLAILAEIF